MSETTPTGSSLPDGDPALRPERLGATAELGRTGGALRPERLGALARELPAWTVDGAGRKLERTFHWPDRAAAVAFAALAATAGDAFARGPGDPPRGEHRDRPLHRPRRRAQRRAGGGGAGARRAMGRAGGGLSVLMTRR